MKTFSKYLKDRETTIDYLLNRPRGKYTPGTYHKLRVEIKKLNALFYLLDFCSKKFNRKKSFKSFKSIFQQAGKVRELQLEESMLNKIFPGDSLPVFKTQVRMLRNREQKIFFSLTDLKLIKKIKRKCIDSIPFIANLRKGVVLDFLRRRKVKIEKQLSKENLNMEQLHQLRKQIKLFINIAKCLSGHKYNKFISKLHSLSKLLGKWHDDQLLIAHLQKTIKSKTIPRNEIKDLNRVIRMIISENNIIFKKIQLVR